MKPLNWQVLLRICLLVLSALFYFLHYLIFRDAHHIFIYLIGDVAFVFIEVLLVTLIIHSVLEQREKKARLEKLNMVIGVFYSEVGTRLLEILSKWDPQIESIQKARKSLQGLPDADHRHLSGDIKRVYGQLAL
jgi:hypothetical protein